MYDGIVHASVMDNETLFDRAGGIRKTAELLGKPPTTIQSWKNTGRIPAHEQPTVLEKFRAAGIEITLEDVVFPLGVPGTEAA